MNGEAEKLVLRCGDSLCTVVPAIGGSIASWTVGGQPMLRGASDDAIDPRAMASFPLVPFSNRIAAGRFTVDGEVFSLPQTWPNEPLPLHGIGMVRPWQVGDAHVHRLTMTLDHTGDGHWPFAFSAAQSVTVGDDWLEIAMTVTNRASRAVPGAFGHHPYFETAGASLRFHAAHFWSNCAEGLPLAAATPVGSFDFTDCATVSDRAVDNIYTGWDGIAKIAWEGRRCALTIHASTSVPAAIVYIPAGESYFCFEPVPHLTDAINRPGCPAPMPLLGPGERFEAQIRMRAVPATP